MSSLGHQSLTPADPKPNISEAWIPTKFGGDYPPLTSLNKTLQDPRRSKIFLHGGLHPGEKDDIPQPYFHVCDTETMEFTDLTNSLAYVTPGDPYSFKALQSGNTPLPTLSEPGIAFLEINGHPMVFLVGGHDAGDADRPTSDVIAIHTIHREWWYVKFENDENGDYPTPAARITSVVVGCNDHLYIFGGIERFEDDGNWTHQRTFSVLEFQEDAHKARWVAMDVPYPIDVPREHVFGKAVAVQNGTMILLLPGRAKQDIKVDFRNDNLFYFVTLNNSFQRVNSKGELPKDIHWSYACSLEPGTRSTDTPSVLICTWIPYGDKYLAPEIWRYYVYPKDQCVCLKLNKKFFELNLNLRRFALVGENVFVMGQGGDGGEESDDDSGTDEGAMCDTYVRVPVRSIL